MKKKYQSEIYVDQSGQFRWSLRNLNNGKLTANGGEAYATESSARRAARSVGLALLVTSIKRVKRSHKNGDHRNAGVIL